MPLSAVHAEFLAKQGAIKCRRRSFLTKYRHLFLSHTIHAKLSPECISRRRVLFMDRAGEGPNRECSPMLGDGEEGGMDARRRDFCSGCRGRPGAAATHDLAHVGCSSARQIARIVASRKGWSLSRRSMRWLMPMSTSSAPQWCGGQLPGASRVTTAANASSLICSPPAGRFGIARAVRRCRQRRAPRHRPPASARTPAAAPRGSIPRASDRGGLVPDPRQSSSGRGSQCAADESARVAWSHYQRTHRLTP
jgi:hypothetical protein